MRHIPFRIGRRERDAWVLCMLQAVDAAGIEEPARTGMRKYFEDAATFLMNVEEPRGMNLAQPSDNLAS